MNARTTALGVVCMGLLASSPSAFASYLFNTGTPNPQPNVTNPPVTTAPVRGVQFTVTAPVTITSVEHYASVIAPDDPNNPNDGVASFRFFIRANAAELCTGGPTANPVFQCPEGAPYDFSKDLFGSSITLANAASQWIGLTGLSWTLQPGIYWVLRAQTSPGGVAAISSPFCGSDTGCTGFVGQAYEDSNALGNSGAWTPNGARTGWRVGIRAVPEPGSLALLGLGLAGLALSRRRRAVA